MQKLDEQPTEELEVTDFKFLFYVLMRKDGKVYAEFTLRDMEVKLACLLRSALEYPGFEAAALAFHILLSHKDDLQPRWKLMRKCLGYNVEEVDNAARDMFQAWQNSFDKIVVLSFDTLASIDTKWENLLVLLTGLNPSVSPLKIPLSTLESELKKLELFSSEDYTTNFGQEQAQIAAAFNVSRKAPHQRKRRYTRTKST